MDYVEAISRSLNLDPRPAPQAAPNSSPVPLPASFQVTGADGHYQVTVTNHPANSQPVLHEIASSSSLNFDLSGGVSVLGPDPRTSWTVANPASTRFWRLRSCFLAPALTHPNFHPAQRHGTHGSRIRRTALEFHRRPHPALGQLRHRQRRISARRTVIGQWGYQRWHAHAQLAGCLDQF